jgi:hypothetical protein
MTRTPRLLLASTLLAGGALTACGDDIAPGSDGGPDAAPCTTARSERYFPVAVGAVWSYRVTQAAGGPAEIKSSTVEALEDVGDRKAGTIAFRIRTEKIDGSTVSWQEDLCTSVTRHREQSFDLAGTRQSDQFYVPDKLRIDETPEHTATGASWPVGYTEVEIDAQGIMRTQSKDETWTVLAASESVVVPAGTFEALKVRKVTSGDADKTFWFAKGVGKVKEEGEQIEELTSFTLPP